MEKKSFQAESKRLLELMIHSIYTNKEIFLRELISNASDALDKLRLISLTDREVPTDFSIKIDADKENRVLTITDNGIGMTKEELESNLGTIAKSGSFDFKKENEQKDVSIIGQFGVGFYSAFMVSDKVEVITKAYGASEGYIWASSGTDGYTIEPYDKETHGTSVILHLQPNKDDEDYDAFLDQYRLKALVKKYSDYIRYPIQMDVESRTKKEGTDDEWETTVNLETLNSMVPIWKRDKSETSDEDYNNFYKEKFFDFSDPLLTVRAQTEGSATYTALLFLPSRAPMNYYTKDYKKGLALYSSGVLIMERCEELLPDYFGFFRGLVDSQDLSLNISREMLQQDKMLKLIAKSLSKKIKRELTSLLQKDREKYEKFFEQFGPQLKYGCYSDYGLHKDELKDLLLFYSSLDEKLVTLKEYRERMKEEQKAIYYVCGGSTSVCASLPQTEAVLEKGFEILYLTDGMDEFVLKTIAEYDSIPFVNVSAADNSLESDDQKDKISKLEEENKDLIQSLTEALEGKVKKISLSSRLKSHPVCLSSEGELSLGMEKVLNAVPAGEKASAEKVLEINPEHTIFSKLLSLQKEDPAALAEYAKLLYTQAALIEGIAPEDPVAFVDSVCKFI